MNTLWFNKMSSMNKWYGFKMSLYIHQNSHLNIIWLKKEPSLCQQETHRLLHKSVWFEAVKGALKRRMSSNFTIPDQNMGTQLVNTQWAPIFQLQVCYPANDSSLWGHKQNTLLFRRGFFPNLRGRYPSPFNQKKDTNCKQLHVRRVWDRQSNCQVAHDL